MHAIKHNEISRYGSIALCAVIAGLGLFGLPQLQDRSSFQELFNRVRMVPSGPAIR